MEFAIPSLLSLGLPLVGVPVLIHLINLRRQRRIRWAAMQFLLESQRRNRRWILLKQLLLLATRMAVVAVLVMMLAKLIIRNQWFSMLGRGRTHHVVLLDDSYSMSDRWDSNSALAEAKRAVQAIVDQAHGQSDVGLLTLLRFSEAAGLASGAQPQLFAQSIDDTFRSRLESVLADMDASQTDAGPADVLKALRRLPLDNDHQALVVYVVSDFRARQYAPATELRGLLDDLSEEVSQLHFVRCVQTAQPNLAITSLAPASGVRAAGVEMWMDLTVVNYGDSPARGVTVQLEQDGDALPALALEDIPAREELTHRFRVQFAGTGAHWLSASLGADAVDVDNRRYFACQLPSARPVLLIDGSPDGQGAYQLSLALDPGGTARTGWMPHVEPVSYLSDVEQLAEQAAVCLLDVPRLGDDELAALEAYVRDGGGLAVFVGSQVDRRYYNNRLYRDGTGLMPVPLKLPVQLLDTRGESVPDVEVTDHPLFRVLAGRRNDFLPLLLVDYYYATPDDWLPSDDDSLQVVARLRNGAPLVVEKPFGKGRVVAQLTKISTGDTMLGRWSNWSLNPAFPVLANELASYLASGRTRDELYGIGDDLTVAVTEADYEPTFRFLLPSGDLRQAELPVDATPTHGLLGATLPSVAASGIYEVQLQQRQGKVERRAFAVNVPVGEGDLQIADREQLSRHWDGLNYQWHEASDMAIRDEHLAGFQMSDVLLVTLVILLLLEQLLAFVASYHLRPAPGRMG